MVAIQMIHHHGVYGILKQLKIHFDIGRRNSLSFFLFQALTRILTQMKCDRDRSFAEMIAQCRLYYFYDTVTVSEDFEHIFKFRRYIIDRH
jgi:hypothetical protein